MGDYERRLHRLEDCATVSDADRDKEFAELVRKRSAELSSSKERLTYRPTPEEVWRVEEEWPAQREKLMKKIELERVKFVAIKLALGIR